MNTLASQHPFHPRFEFAFTIVIELTGARWIKPSNMDMTRAAVYAGSGTIECPLLPGKVIPMPGGDFPLVRPDGVIDFDARYLLEADDDYYTRVSPKFDVPEGPHHK